jgi:hypothetical protein
MPEAALCTGIGGLSGILAGPPKFFLKIIGDFASILHIANEPAEERNTPE